jgi:hypothetical protein
MAGHETAIPAVEFGSCAPSAVGSEASRLRLRGRPIHLPGHRADARFLTQPSHNLFHCRVIAIRRRHSRDNSYVRRVWNIGTIDASHAELSLRKCMKQQQPQVRFFHAFALHCDGINGLGMCRKQVFGVDQPYRCTQQEVGSDFKSSSHQAGSPKPGAGESAYHRATQKTLIRFASGSN